MSAKVVRDAEWYKRFRERAHRADARYKATRKRQLAELKDFPCADCGGKFPACAMDFDHVRGKKLFTIGKDMKRSWSSMLLEIAKCDIVCANCHRIRTHSPKGESHS